MKHWHTQYRIHPSLCILYTKIKYHWKLEETTSFLFHCIRKTKPNTTKPKTNSHDMNLLFFKLQMGFKISNIAYKLHFFKFNLCLFRAIVSFTTAGYISVPWLQAYRAKATIAHDNSMMALTIGTLAPLHRSPLQQSTSHLVIFTEGFLFWQFGMQTDELAHPLA